jgi:regulator of sigma E protease
MTSLIYLFAFVLVLSIVVIVHEGGHFLMARLCGVQVVEFSLGFGKELWARCDKKGTRWKVCLIPLGGYVKMLGDEDAASAKGSTKDIPPEDFPLSGLEAPDVWTPVALPAASPRESPDHTISSKVPPDNKIHNSPATLRSADCIL